MVYDISKLNYAQKRTQHSWFCWWHDHEGDSLLEDAAFKAELEANPVIVRIGLSWINTENILKTEFVGQDRDGSKLYDVDFRDGTHMLIGQSENQQLQAFLMENQPNA